MTKKILFSPILFTDEEMEIKGHKLKQETERERKKWDSYLKQLKRLNFN